MSMCIRCKKPLSKPDEKKRIEERRQPDGSTEFFGIATGLKSLEQAKGKFVSVYHYKCYFVMKKHDRMGPNGRYLDDSPTAYQQAQKYENRDDLTDEAKARRLRAEAEYAALQERLMLAKQAAYEAGQSLDDAPTDVLDLEKELADAEAAVSLAKRQEEVAEEREKEETPSAWADWRDPTTLEI